MHGSELFRMDGQVCVVTGASSGIGLRMAQCLHEAGATVLMAARRTERLAASASEMERAHAVRCDLTVDEDIESLIARARELGGPDVLVNNAGAVGHTTADTQSIAEFRAGLQVNLIAPFQLAQLAAFEMRRKGAGSIVNVVSILGLVGGGQLGTEPSYTASKGALVTLTRELAAQWATQGVRVNAIAPGWFSTEMTQDMFANEQANKWIERNTPMRRTGETSELDGALLFLASNKASSFVTGQVLAVDGGWTAV
jgi:NAD(P)-dependent dehydrogenase (short-subunit alcohol dehydrogenase family)